MTRSHAGTHNVLRTMSLRNNMSKQSGMYSLRHMSENAISYTGGKNELLHLRRVYVIVPLV